MMIHRHEDSVDDDAQRNEHVDERVHYEQLHEVGEPVNKQPDETAWTHGQNNRREITEKFGDKETREGCRKRGRPQLRWGGGGGLCEEISKKGRGGRKVERKRGRPQLRWGDCVKRDLRKAEEEEKWRENEEDHS